MRATFLSPTDWTPSALHARPTGTQDNLKTKTGDVSALPALDGRQSNADHVRMARKALIPPAIPHIESIEGLARFWDTHDPNDYEAELEEVGEPVFNAEAQPVMRIRLLPEQAQALKRRAQAAGVPQADLVREWIAEKLSTQ